MTYLRSKLEFVNHQIMMTFIGLEMLLNNMNRVKMCPVKKRLLIASNKRKSFKIDIYNITYKYFNIFHSRLTHTLSFKYDNYTV